MPASEKRPKPFQHFKSKFFPRELRTLKKEGRGNREVVKRRGKGGREGNKR